jgi:multidrug efflux pump subunit AcrA (membrane-fusion protein)
MTDANEHPRPAADNPPAPKSPTLRALEAAAQALETTAEQLLADRARNEERLEALARTLADERSARTALAERLQSLTEAQAKSSGAIERALQAAAQAAEAAAADRRQLESRLRALEERLPGPAAAAPGERAGGDPPADAEVPATPAEGGVSARQAAELADKLRLLNALDEGLWQEWPRHADAVCRLAAWLVALFLPPDSPRAVLEAVDDWLQETSQGDVRLILPRRGDTFDTRRHRKVRETPSGGLRHAVLSVWRAGVECAGGVRQRAEVEVAA